LAGQSKQISAERCNKSRGGVSLPSIVDVKKSHRTAKKTFNNIFHDIIILWAGDTAAWTF